MDGIQVPLRFASQANQRQRAVSGMGDYVALLPNRVLTSKGDIQGPISTPLQPGPQTTAPSTPDMLQQIYDALKALPAALSLEWRTKFKIKPREIVPFIAVNSNVVVAGNATVAVVSLVVDERATGFLEKVGVNVQGGAFPNIVWQLRINGQVHPKFTSDIFDASTLATPLEFPYELVQSRTIQLVAINTVAGAITVDGILTGWTEYMSTFKPYGGQSSSGIA